jgi:hypothetical protein
MPRNTKWPVYLIGSERPPIAAQQQPLDNSSSSSSMDISSSSSSSASSSAGGGSSSEPIAFGYLQSTTLAQEVNLVVSNGHFCNAHIVVYVIKTVLLRS